MSLFTIAICSLTALSLVACAASPIEDRCGEAPDAILIGVCQLRCVDGDREGNLERIGGAVRSAAEAGAEIACFPETAILGWVNPEAHELADSIPGATTDRLAALARENDIMLAIGLAERAGECLHDSAILIDRDGSLLLKHRKVNILSELMDPPYTPGAIEQENVVDTTLGRIGMLICADSFEEEVVAAMARKEPDLLVVPYGWAASENAWPDHGEQLEAWVTYLGRTVGCPVVGVDVVGEITHGPWTGKTYGGQSLISDAEGRVIVVLADREEQVLVVPVSVGR